MAFVDFDLFKKSVHVDYDVEDDLLRHYLTDGETEAVRMTERTEEELKEMGDGEMPAPIRTAAMLLAKDLFEGDFKNGRQEGLLARVYSLVYPYKSLVK